MIIGAIGATSDDPTVQKVGTFVGSIMMMYGAGAKGLGLSAAENGALVGFSTTYISTGDLTHDNGFRCHAQEPQKQKSNCGSSSLKSLLNTTTITER